MLRSEYNFSTSSSPFPSRKSLESKLIVRGNVKTMLRLLRHTSLWGGKDDQPFRSTVEISGNVSICQ